MNCVFTKTAVFRVAPQGAGNSEHDFLHSDKCRGVHGTFMPMCVWTELYAVVPAPELEADEEWGSGDFHV